MPSEQEIHNRRSFLRTATSSIGLVLGASTIAALVDGCESNETAPTPPSKKYTYDVTTNPDLDTVGSIGIDIIGDLNNGQPVFLSRIADTTFVVFSAVCTHQGCIVNLPSSAGNNCECPCHGSQFAVANGHVVKQPSVGEATDLPMFASSYDATTHILTISS